MHENGIRPEVPFRVNLGPSRRPRPASSTARPGWLPRRPSPVGSR